MSLLQTWIYEHFPSLGRCGGVETYDESTPRICKWKLAPGRTNIDLAVRTIREQLDDLSPNNIIWDPYHNHQNHFPLKPICFYTGLLVCFELVEPYYPDRILRQLGQVQIIPTRPLRPKKERTRSTCTSYRCQYNTEDWHWTYWHGHIIAQSRCTPVFFPSECVDGYMDWYNKVSHPRVQNPNHRVHQIMRSDPGVGSRRGAPATGAFSRRLKFIANLLRCGSEADRPVSPTTMRHAVNLIDMYTVDEDLAEFEELGGASQVGEKTMLFRVLHHQRRPKKQRRGSSTVDREEVKDDLFFVKLVKNLLL